MHAAAGEIAKKKNQAQKTQNKLNAVRGGWGAGGGAGQ
jgi:hypothetical protein